MSGHSGEETDNDGETARIERTLVIRKSAQPRAPALQVGHYLVFHQDGQLRRLPIGASGLTVGRVPPCDLVIARPEISRRHCRIEIDGDWAVASDLGSTNGTLLGGQRLEQPARLRNGAQLELGPVLLRYEQRDQREVEEEQGFADDLRNAVEYVRAILPAPLAAGPVLADWWFVPSARLSGDAFGYQMLDDGCFAGFLLDVSGHGIGSALHAVNVANAVRRRTLPGVDFREPAQVAAALNAAFPMEAHNELILTLWYFAFDLASRVLRYCAAGHHPSFLVSPDAPEPVPLWCRSPAIGMLPRANWGVGSAVIPPGSRLYIFSDGAFEIDGANGESWVLEDLRKLIMAPETPGVSEAQRLYQAARAAARPGPLADDFSVLVLRFA